MIVTKIVIPNYKYNSVIEAKESGDYKTAVEKFVELGDFKDSKEQITDSKYLQANELIKLKDYADAAQKFAEVEGYKDTEKLKERAGILKAKENILNISNAEVNDTVQFGNYKGNTEWIVLDKRDKKLLLLSKDALEYRPYNTKYVKIEWKDCTLRKWLNSDYISSAFNTAEKKIIEKSKLKNIFYVKNKNKGKETIDQVFLLSIDEVTYYLKSPETRKVDIGNEKDNTWWLRTSGRWYAYASIVGENGKVNKIGSVVFSTSTAVRPAMWVDVSKAGC